jgi:hypothetical protein
MRNRLIDWPMMLRISAQRAIAAFTSLLWHTMLANQPVWHGGGNKLRNGTASRTVSEGDDACGMASEVCEGERPWHGERERRLWLAAENDLKCGNIKK